MIYVTYYVNILQNVHNSETVQCDKCEFTTNTKDKLKIHMRRTHLNTLKTCPVIQPHEKISYYILSISITDFFPHTLIYSVSHPHSCQYFMLYFTQVCKKQVRMLKRHWEVTKVKYELTKLLNILISSQLIYFFRPIIY